MSGQFFEQTQYVGVPTHPDVMSVRLFVGWSDCPSREHLYIGLIVNAYVQIFFCQSATFVNYGPTLRS